MEKKRKLNLPFLPLVPLAPLVEESGDLILSLLIQNAPKIALQLRLVSKAMKKECDKWIAIRSKPFIESKFRNILANTNSNTLSSFSLEQGYLENIFGGSLFKFIIFDVIQTLCIENKLNNQKCILLFEFVCSIFGKLKSFYLKSSNAIIYILMFERNRNTQDDSKIFNITPKIVAPFNPYDQFIVAFTNMIHRACFSQNLPINKQNWNDMMTISGKLFETYNDKIPLCLEDSLIFHKYQFV